MSGHDTIKRKAAERNRGRTDWERVRALTDADIAQAVADDPDAAPLLDDAWFAAAEVDSMPPKVMVTMRIDPDIVDYFKQAGPGYQTRINAVLRAYVDHHRR